jgi:hypothetical protein
LQCGAEHLIPASLFNLYFGILFLLYLVSETQFSIGSAGKFEAMSCCIAKKMPSSVVVGTMMGGYQFRVTPDQAVPHYFSFPSAALSCYSNPPATEAWFGCRDGHIRFFDARQTGHRPPSHSMTMSSSVHRLHALPRHSHLSMVGIAMDGSIRLWDTRFLKSHLRSFQGHRNTHFDTASCVSEDGSHLFCIGSDRVVRAWSIWGGYGVDYPASEWQLASSASSPVALSRVPSAMVYRNIGKGDLPGRRPGLIICDGDLVLIDDD